MSSPNATGRFRDGVFMATHTFFRDITDRKEAEALTERYQQKLEQEVAERTAALVQSEELATLGRLSAGMAHELNNPAAAAQRGAVLLRDTLSETYRKFFDLATHELSDLEAAHLSELVERGISRAAAPDTLDAMSRGDREADVEDWLQDHGIAEPRELASPIVSLEMGVTDLDEIAGNFAPEKLPSALSLMTHTYTAFARWRRSGMAQARLPRS